MIFAIEFLASVADLLLKRITARVFGPIEDPIAVKTEQTQLGLDSIHPPDQWSHLRELGTADNMVAPMIFKNVLTFSISFKSQTDTTKAESQTF